MIDEIFYKPRTGEEVKRASGGAPVYPYSQLNEMVEHLGIENTLTMMFARSLKNIILLQDPRKMNSGHWLGLSYNPSKGEIYFFSSYGGKPDAEKNKWLTEDDQVESGQGVDVFNDGLKELAKKGYVIHYNDHPYQFEGDETATCGIWTVAFLNSDMNPDQFYRYNVRHHQGPVQYFYKYFL